MLMIDYDDVWARLSPTGAVDALEEAIRSEGLGEAPLRSHATNGDQQLLCMPCFRGEGAGVKLITIDPANPDRGMPLLQGVFVLFSAPTLEPSAIIDGRALTELRTAAVSGVATRLLARPDSERLLIVGAGAQGHSHLLVMHAVLPDLRHVDVLSRSRGPAEALVTRARDELGLDAEVATPDAVATADVICTCTPSVTPVVAGALLPEGVHVNAVGAYRPDMREIDTEGVISSRVYVETRETALAEAGDLIIPQDEARFDPTSIAADLTELVRGRGRREHADERTLFTSVGVAFEDLVVAAAIIG